MHKPRIVLSRCFCEPVRYDGKKIYNPFIEKLKKYVDITTVCPEVDIGLGVPRNKIFLIKKQDYRIYYRGKDITESIIDFSKSFISRIGDIDGFLLKSKSPSCGVVGAKTYSNPDGTGFLGRRQGVFARIIKKHFPYLPVEDELKLENLYLRYSFLTRIFLYSYFKNTEDKTFFLTQYGKILSMFNQKSFKIFKKDPQIKNLRNILKRNISEKKIKSICPKLENCPELIVFPENLLYTEK